MTHEQALQAAQDTYFNRANPLLREDGINAAVRAYLEARAEDAETEQVTQGNYARYLLHDFGGDE